MITSQIISNYAVSVATAWLEIMISTCLTKQELCRCKVTKFNNGNVWKIMFFYLNSSSSSLLFSFAPPLKESHSQAPGSKIYDTSIQV